MAARTGVTARQSGTPGLGYENRGRPQGLGIPRLSIRDRIVLERYRRPQTNVLGKVWNSPNTAIGIALGLLGHGAAVAMGDKPQIDFGNNAIQFTNNPVGGVSAITLGNAIIYSKEDGPDVLDAKGVATGDHERQHTFQGEMLGPLYLPSNVAGGLTALIRDGTWHGRHNWNEVGPQSAPRRPWGR